MDPDQTFVVNSVTRKDIAEAINDVLDGEGDGRREFADGDVRLTDELCRTYAALLGECEGETADETDLLAYRMAVAFVREFFPRLK